MPLTKIRPPNGRSVRNFSFRRSSMHSTTGSPKMDYLNQRIFGLPMTPLSNIVATVRFNFNRNKNNKTDDKKLEVVCITVGYDPIALNKKLKSLVLKGKIRIRKNKRTWDHELNSIHDPNSCLNPSSKKAKSHPLSVHLFAFIDETVGRWVTNRQPVPGIGGPIGQSLSFTLTHIVISRLKKPKLLKSLVHPDMGKFNIGRFLIKKWMDGMDFCRKRHGSTRKRMRDRSNGSPWTISPHFSANNFRFGQYVNSWWFL